MTLAFDITAAKLDERDMELLCSAALLQLEQQRITYQEYADILTKLNEYGIRNGLGYGKNAANTTDEDEDIADGI